MTVTPTLSLTTPKSDPATDEHSRLVPEAPVFDATTAKVDDIIQGMIKAGGIIIRDIISSEILTQVEQDNKKHILADGEWVGDLSRLTDSGLVTSGSGLSQGLQA